MVENLKKIRTEQNIQQKELAEKLQIARSTISCYETMNNEPPIDLLIKMADILNVSVDYLIGRTNEQEEVIKEDFTNEERELIKYFRACNTNHKTQITAFAKTLADTHISQNVV